MFAGEALDQRAVERLGEASVRHGAEDAEGGKFLPPNMEPSEGPQAIQTAMQQLLDMGARSLDVEPLDVREAGDLTIEYGRYRLGIGPEGAEAVTDEGKYVVVHETQDDGSTKIMLDIFNSNSPPPG